MGNMEIGIYFIMILAGVLMGLFIGFTFLDIFSLRREKKKIKRIKRSKNKQPKVKQSKERGNPVKNKNLLTDRVKEKESYTQCLCESFAQNKNDYINNARKTQDQKYTSRTR